MPIARLPLAFNIESRTASLDKDSKLVNAMVETIGEAEYNVVKRPGLVEETNTGAAIPASQGRGIFSWYNRIIAGVGTDLFSIVGTDGAGVVDNLGTLSGTEQYPLSFVTTANENYLAFHDGSSLYTILQSAPTSFTNNTGGTAVLSASVPTPGGRYSTAPTVTFTGGGVADGHADHAAGTAVLLDHTVYSITITDVGVYTSTPTITLSAPPTGTTATATQSSTNYNSYTATVVSGGSGYLVAPSVTWPPIDNPTGQLPLGYTLINSSGVVTSIVMTQAAAGGYDASSFPLTLTIAPPPNQTALATANMNSTISGPWAPGIAYLDGYVYVLQKGSNRSSAVTVVAATDVFSWTGHGLTAGTPISFTAATIPPGVTSGTIYYVIASGLTADAFKVSATSGGSTIDVTDTGTTVVANVATSSVIYGSAQENPTSWSALNFISAASDPDDGVAIAKHLNYIVIFGQWSTEFFYNAGTSGTGSPLLPNQSAKLEIGCANGYSVASAEQTLIWVGNSLTNGKSVFMLQGLSPIRVSNKYIDKYLNASPMTAVDSVRAICFKIAGHTLYCLTLDDISKTFVYDMDEKKWYNWTSQTGDTTGTDGTETYWKMTSYTGSIGYNPAIYLQGDHDGKIYKLDMDYYDDDGDKIYFRAVSPIVDSGTTKRKFYRRVEVVGDKVTGNLKIRHCSDDYQTWSTYRTVALANLRPILWQNGQARRRAWEVFSSDSIPIRLRALELEFDIGETGGGQEG